MSTSEWGIGRGRVGPGWADVGGSSCGLARLGALVGLVLVEILSFSLRFDTGSIDGRRPRLPGAARTVASRSLEMVPSGPPRGAAPWLLEHGPLMLAIG